MVSIDRTEVMSKEELLRLNGALDVADEELIAIISQGVHGKRKK